VGIVLTIVAALVLGALWVVLLRRRPRRSGVAGAPKDVDEVLDRYRKAQWQRVVDDAPGVLARPSDGGDKAWRPRLELALGHSLVELDDFDGAIPHLERGLLLQSAVRRSQTGSDVPESADATFRHLLGWSYAQTGRTAQARREYRRVLETPGLTEPVRARVEAGLAAIDGPVD
jgi:hypothetical protein